MVGPAPGRPYSRVLSPFDWRRWWDFGAAARRHGLPLHGPALWALDLHHPTGQAEDRAASGRCSGRAGRLLGVPGPRSNRPSSSPGTTAAETRPVKDAQVAGAHGVLFVGAKGMLLADYRTTSCCPGSSTRVSLAEPYIPDSVGHYKEWVQACKNGGHDDLQLRLLRRADRGGAPGQRRLSPGQGARLGREEPAGNQRTGSRTVSTAGVPEAVEVVIRRSTGMKHTESVGKTSKSNVSSTRPSDQVLPTL